MGKKINNGEEFQAKNWKQLSKVQIQELHPIQRSKYLAYEAPLVPDGSKKAESRLLEEGKRKKILAQEKKLAANYNLQRKKDESVIGQLKASEACNRVKSLRSQYNSNRTEEITHLISTQPTAIKAVRLQSILPPICSKIKFKDFVVKEQRTRIEVLMEDELGLETDRILC